MRAPSDHEEVRTKLAYDPLMRLYQASTSRWAYDGAEMIAEYNTSNALLRRFVHGPGVDEPLVWYEGTGTTNRRWLHADERGSVVAISDGTGTVIGTNRYDEYGMPTSPTVGRFQYTGQVWIASLGMYYYRARFYHPRLGRFMQTDPIGYGAGMNLYAYVRNDPLNLTDPLGLQDCPVWQCGGPINVVGSIGGAPGGGGGGGSGGVPRGARINEDMECVAGDPDTCEVVINGRRIGPNPQPSPSSPVQPPFQLQPLVTLASSGPRQPHRCTAGSDSPFGHDFREACRRHDECYRTIGASQAACDVKFLLDLGAVCARAGNPRLCQVAAAGYFSAVTNFGAPAFLYEQFNAIW